MCHDSKLQIAYCRAYRSSSRPLRATRTRYRIGRVTDMKSYVLKREQDRSPGARVGVLKATIVVFSGVADPSTMEKPGRHV
jgi:hypothetical protein